MASTITVFRDEDDSFFAWLTMHPEGFFLNNRGTGGLMLHRGDCPHYKGTFAPQATSNPKFCTARRQDLEECSPDAKLCSDCFG